jgi:uncharacterized membrane protein YciS (DUF1049 family)
MSNSTLLTVGYVLVTVLYAGYWISLKMRLSKLKNKGK